jgi:hypothetical protein
LVDIYGGREDKLLMMEILRSQFDSFFFWEREKCGILRSQFDSPRQY